jgi:hypothetical protein
MRIPHAPAPVIVALTTLALSAAPILLAQDSAAAAKRAAEDKAAAEAKAAASPSPDARRGVRPTDIQKVFVIKHVRVDDLARVLSVFPAEVNGMERDDMRVLSVSAAPAVVAAIEEVIKRLDVPPPAVKNVEVTFYVLECAASGDANSLPQDLQSVFVQLKRTFNYSGCSLARTLFTRGSSRFNADFNERTAGNYRVNSRIDVDSSTPPVVRLRNLDLVNIYGVQRSQISGDVEVRDGQKVVFGRLGTTESGKDQIVVLTAKVAP